MVGGGLVCVCWISIWWKVWIFWKRIKISWTKFFAREPWITRQRCGTRVNREPLNKTHVHSLRGILVIHAYAEDCVPLLTKALESPYAKGSRPFTAWYGDQSCPRWGVQVHKSHINWRNKLRQGFILEDCWWIITGCWFQKIFRRAGFGTKAIGNFRRLCADLR